MNYKQHAFVERRRPFGRVTGSKILLLPERDIPASKKISNYLAGQRASYVVPRPVNSV
jgi:hypothetical protein